MMRLALILALLLCAAPVQAADCYVATTGNEANAGTEGSPKLRIKTCVALTDAGEATIIRGGTYTHTEDRIDTSNYTVNSGTSYVNAVTIKAYPSETVIIEPGALNLPCIRLAAGGRAYIIVQDLICDGTGNPSENLIYTSDGTNHIRFERIEVRDAANFGIVFSDNNADGVATFNEVLDSSIHDIGTVGQPGTNGHCFYVSTSDNLFQGNDLNRCLGYGFHLFNDIGAEDIDRNIIRANRIRNGGRPGVTTAFGVTINWGQDNLISNNVIDSNTGCIQAFASGETGLTIAHNTCYNNLDYGIALASNTPIVKNNIVYLNGTGISHAGANITNNLTTDPTFVNAGAFDFHLQTTSAAKNAGVCLGLVGDDFDGLARPSGADCDIGAYEFDEGAPPPPAALPRLRFR